MWPDGGSGRKSCVIFGVIGCHVGALGVPVSPNLGVAAEAEPLELKLRELCTELLPNVQHSLLPLKSCGGLILRLRPIN